MESQPACQAGDDLLSGRPDRLARWPLIRDDLRSRQQRNEYSEAYLKLLLHFRDMLQADLKSFARLHGEIEEREAKIRRLVDANIIGIIIWDLEGRILEANDAFRVQLQQVLVNLIINAIEAMRDVGEEERELLISSRNEPDGVSVEVRDSGPGFAPAALERVFEAFYTTKPGGLGMGLSICRSIIEAHNGQLWASANLPRGASFQFALPTIANTAS